MPSIANSELDAHEEMGAQALSPALTKRESSGSPIGKARDQVTKRSCDVMARLGETHASS